MAVKPERLLLTEREDCATETSLKFDVVKGSCQVSRFCVRTKLFDCGLAITIDSFLQTMRVPACSQKRKGVAPFVAIARGGV